MNLKSLLFGSAAVLAAGTGAQAADLPVAEPVEYVRICDAFGTGFYYIPGTDTCLRISGRVRVEAHYVDQWGDDDDDDDDDDGNSDLLLGGVDQNFNNYTTRARGNMRLDARTQTDLGLIRAFAEFQVTVGPGNTSSQTTEEAFNGDANYDGANVDLSAAFIQISNDAGTFTAGHTGSFFDFFGSLGFGTRINIDDNTTEQTLFAYTFGGGNGFGATLSIEDPASSGRRLNGEEDYEGQEWPDLVGNIRVDQGWGSAQVMGVLHHVHDKDTIDPGEGPDDDDHLGWAAGAGASFKVAGLGFSAQGGYADGALGYITTDPGGVGDLSDEESDSETNTAWNIRAGVSAEFSPTLTGQVDASYTDVEEGADEDDGDGDEGYQFWGAKATLIWSPVSGLIMGPEVAYNHIECDGDSCIAVAGDENDDQEDDVWGVMWRIQRDF